METSETNSQQRIFERMLVTIVPLSQRGLFPKSWHFETWFGSNIWDKTEVLTINCKAGHNGKLCSFNIRTKFSLKSANFSIRFSM